MELTTPKRITVKTIRALFFINVIGILVFVIVLSTILFMAKLEGPPSISVPQSTVLYAKDGSKIGETHHGEKRFWVSLNDISPSVLEATIAIEDRNFYDHHGFDYKRIIGAAIADLKAMAKVQGASTITQQYARNLYLEHDKTWKRKLTEAFYTIRLEMNFTKEEIVEGYLNTIYYGHGAYGIEAAARYYFDKHASELTLGEAAMLVGIPKGPSYYSPYVNLSRAKERQELILSEMVKEGFITKEEREKASEEPLELKEQEAVKKIDIAPYFQDIVLQKVKNLLNIDEQIIQTKGLRVYTTLNSSLQKIAEETVTNVIDENSDIQVGFTAMDPNTGEVKALIGGRDYEKSSFNRVTQAKRQPGSTMKPLLYYAAIENGFTPSTPLRSEPTTFRYGENEQGTYKPSNYNDYYAYDDITLLQALALSDNIYAVKTHLFMSMNELVQTAKTVGIHSPLKEVPSLALGTSPVSVLEMVNAYGILANGGKKVEPIFITRIEDAKGNVLYKEKRQLEQLLNKQAAFVTTHMMTGMFDKKLNGYTTVTGQKVIDLLTRPYAGKSGSTKADSWMIGYTPQLVAGVWTGYDKGKTIDLVLERSYAKQIWAHFMEEALEDQSVKSFRPPEGVVGVYVDPSSGLLASPTCPVSRLTYYIQGTEPTDYCLEHLEHTKEKKEEDKDPPEDPSIWDKLIPWL
ncbi:PBP1A family penicillin-binding protein [Bacillus sp. FJAT-47783]|uniref:transglycosylase domain-containing protein n=1 Tax=Bacillus sp. FJAT-47783 TaxID=2922712 RepID=UPI001FAB63B3|nr:PBP1A family penicillin-binding protein [Bacillus sp. FJAT-47783]